MRLTRDFVAGFLAGWIFLAGGAHVADGATGAGPEVRVDHRFVSAGAENETGTHAEKQPPNRERLKLALFICISFLTALFFMVLLISAIRMGRLQRRRLRIGQKGERTEYVDAWSRYRLKNDPSENSGPSAKNED